MFAAASMCSSAAKWLVFEGGNSENGMFPFGSETQRNATHFGCFSSLDTNMAQSFDWGPPQKWLADIHFHTKIMSQLNFTPCLQPDCAGQERDKRNFRRLCDALAVVGFTAEDMDAIFQAAQGTLFTGSQLRKFAP